MGSGSSESIFAHLVTTRHPVHACKSVATLGMLYNISTQVMEACLPIHVLKRACTPRDTHAYVGSLVELTFLRKLQ